MYERILLEKHSAKQFPFVIILEALRFNRGVSSKIMAFLEEDDEDTEDLEENLKSLLTFGKVIGCYPNSTHLDTVFKIIPLLLGTVALVDLVGIAIKPESIRSATDIAEDIGVPGFYCLGTLLYYYIQRNAPQLQEIFAKWRKLKVTAPDRHLRRFVNLSSVCVLTSAILENATFHFKLFPVFEPAGSYGNISALEFYYRESHGHWALYVPYNPVVSILLCVTNKWALYVWNFADLLVACISRALYFRLSSILQKGQPNWNRVWDDFSKVQELTRLIEKFFSPIIFACYTMNMYALCMQLHMWLTPSESKHLLHTLYLAWSFVHLMARIFLVSVTAAQVHEEVQHFEKRAYSCHAKKFDFEIDRIALIARNPSRGLGLTGMGCFVITRPFILTIFYVAFTFEVFLLQSDSIKVG